MQKARWHNPVCSCLFFYISGYFLLTLYFPFIFSLDSKPPNLGGKKRLQGLVCVCGGVHQLCAVPHRCTSPQYTAGHAACLSQPAPVCSLCESVSFSMEPLETDIKIYPENLLFLRLQKMCLLVPQPRCQILIYLFIFQSDLISQLQRRTFFFCSCSENAMALSHSFCFPCLGAAFREQIICGKALFIWELFSENYLTDSLLLQGPSVSFRR